MPGRPAGSNAGKGTRDLPADADRLMSDLIRLCSTTVNPPTQSRLAVLAEITGGVAKGGEHWALVEGPNGDIGFQQIDDHRTTWPDGEVGMQMHLDFLVDDLEATGARVPTAAPPDSDISQTRTTASCTPTRRNIRSACQRGGSQSGRLNDHGPYWSGKDGQRCAAHCRPGRMLGGTGGI